MAKTLILYNPKPNINLMSKDIPLALLFVAKMVEAKGYQVKIFSDLDERGLILDAAKDALCVGITSMTGNQIIDGLDLAKSIREKYPNIPFVWGGWHPSLLPEQTLENEYVDIVVRGQGEMAFYELVQRLEKKEQLDGLLGISYKKDGRIFNNPQREYEILDNFPAIPYHLVEVEKYLFATEFGDRTVNYVSSYGCPYRCGFCCEQTVTKRRWYPLSADKVLEDMERLVKDYGANAISINDSNFFVNEKRVQEICQGILDRKIKVRWGNANGRTNVLSRYSSKTWELIKESGCYSILTGTESGCQETLNLIKKDIKVEDNIAFAKLASKYGIKVIFSNVVGLPWPQKSKEALYAQTDKEIKHTLADVEKYLSLDSRNRALMFTYAPYPGTPLYENALKLNFKPPASFKEWGKFHLYSLHTPWVTKKQENFVTMLSSYIFLFLDSDFRKWITKSIKNKVKKFMADILIKTFSSIARIRWQYKFFALPFDYYIYKLIRKIQKEV